MYYNENLAESSLYILSPQEGFIIIHLLGVITLLSADLLDVPSCATVDY